MAKKKNNLDDKCVEKITIGKKTTLQEQKTKISLEAVNEFYKIKIDDCIFTSKEEGEQKCDYLIYAMNQETHLFELKGAEVDAAFHQLLSTLEKLEKDDALKQLIEKRNRVDAYIVSPNRITLPNNIDSKKRRLVKKLAKLYEYKPDDLFELVTLIKKVPGGKRSKSNYTITLPASDALQI